MSISKETHDAFSDAMKFGNLEIVESLLRRHPELANHPDWTPPPLHCAILWNQPEVATLLLDHGADIELRDPDRNTTPIRYAVMYCKSDMIPLLFYQGAKTSAVDEGGLTLVELAQSAADGAYEEFDDLPRPHEYEAIVNQLKQLDVE